MPRSQWPRISILEKSFFLSYSFSSLIYKVFVDGLQPPAKIKNSVMFAREQSVDADSRFRGNFLEAETLEFVRKEDFALIFREFLKRRVEFFEQDASRISG